MPGTQISRIVVNFPACHQRDCRNNNGRKQCIPSTLDRACVGTVINHSLPRRPFDYVDPTPFAFSLPLCV